MGQSHSSILNQPSTTSLKRKSFLVTSKKLIRLRRQTSSGENSGAASSVQDGTTQTLNKGENDNQKTADAAAARGMLCKTKTNSPHKSNRHHRAHAFLFRSVVVCKNFMYVFMQQHMQEACGREQNDQNKKNKVDTHVSSFTFTTSIHTKTSSFFSDRHRDTQNTHTYENVEAAKHNDKVAAAAFSHNPTARDESLIEENLLQQLRELIENLLCGGDRIDGDIVLEIDSNEKTLKILPQHSSSLVREDHHEGNYSR
jgi:hypothetical protein